MLTTQERTSENLLAQFSELIEVQMGLHFPHERWRDLERGVTAAAREFGFDDTESCLRELVSTPLSKDQIDVLAGHLTVGETYFCREKQSLAILQNEILPELIRTRQGSQRRLRLWSAGCCTGEEAYTLAFLVTSLLPDPQDWRITILGTDLNPHSLRKASAGVYTRWSFRDTPPGLTERFFEPAPDGRFKVRAKVKEMVTFSTLNLVEDSFPSLANNTNAMDVILCRNVLMYFAPERAHKVVQNFRRALVDGGWLIVSPTETMQPLFTGFTRVSFAGATFYRKDTATAPPPAIAFALLAEPLPPISETRPAIPEPQAPTRSDYEEARALYEQGCYPEAADKLTLWLLQEPTDARAAMLLARVFANQGKLIEALACCEQAIGIDKLDPEHHYLRATILQEQGGVDEAIQSLQRTLYLDDRFVLAHFALGTLARGRGNHHQAGKHWRNASRLLNACQSDEVLPGSDGMTAGRLSEVIASMANLEAAS